MALLSSCTDYQNRQQNKEPEWSSFCDNVFDQFLDSDDIFGLDNHPRERESSQDSLHLFDFSGSSDRSHQTSNTSPFPSWEPLVQESAIEAKQPRAKEPAEFWSKTLRTLEQSAAESERRQQSLRTAKSHPDFLSLGGHPSPPAVPASPTDLSFYSQQRVSRANVAGKRRNITARSLSRGRPTGVTKSAVAGCVNPSATVRKCSTSPTKMMTPSRYRAGFRDVWNDETRRNSKKYELRMPSSALPASPPSSERFVHGGSFDAIHSAPLYAPPSLYDDQISPLTTTFQQAHIHSPITSPFANAVAYASNGYSQLLSPQPYSTRAIPSNNAIRGFPERTTSLVPNQLHSFDFGFHNPSTYDDWNAAPFPGHTSPNYLASPLADRDPYDTLDTTVLPTTETADFDFGALGINYDPTLTSHPRVTNTLDIMAVPPPIYQTTAGGQLPCYAPHAPYALPTTPQHRRARSQYRHTSRYRSRSPSPRPSCATEPRNGRPTTRKTSQHRRAKSTTSSHRRSQNIDKSGFVNYTPFDSTKILSGVAPSGSSKTKARREKEEADKRRRLSQAAVKAVVDAGGDLNVLDDVGVFEEEGLFVTP